MSAPKKKIELTEEQISEIVELAIPIIEEELEKIEKSNSSPERERRINE